VAFLVVVLASLASAASPDVGVAVRSSIGDLHGFPSMSDEAGRVVATGELRQERHGDRLEVHLRWAFHDGRIVEEQDAFEVGRSLRQTRFLWVERRSGVEERRFEVDFEAGRAQAVIRKDGKERRDEARIDRGDRRAFAGYGVALVAAQLPLGAPGEAAELTLVAFTPGPRAVALEVRRDPEERLEEAGRAVASDRYTLHPKIPFPVSVFAHARDGHLWFTHAPPRALVRAEQELVAKDDPRVVIDVVPRVDPQGVRREARRPPAR